MKMKSTLPEKVCNMEVHFRSLSLNHECKKHQNNILFCLLSPSSKIKYSRKSSTMDFYHRTVYYTVSQITNQGFFLSRNPFPELDDCTLIILKIVARQYYFLSRL